MENKKLESGNEEKKINIVGGKTLNNENTTYSCCWSGLYIGFINLAMKIISIYKTINIVKIFSGLIKIRFIIKRQVIITKNKYKEIIVFIAGLCEKGWILEVSIVWEYDTDINVI